MKWTQKRLVLHGLILPVLFCLPALFFAPASHAATDELLRLQQVIRESGARWEAGETSVSNLSIEEKRKLVGARHPTPSDLMTASPMPEPGTLALPPVLDWRANGGNFVTPVRNQGGCGACWAFGPVAALEAKALIKTQQSGTDLDLSEQVVVSCSESGNCIGGQPSGAAGFLMKMGTPLESCYPYATSDGICSWSCPNWFNKAYKAAAWYYGAKPAADELKAMLHAFGPIAASMEVFEDLYSYKGGVYTHVSGNYLAGHSVLVVGYSDVDDCFIVKNSWGTDWGEAGFLRIGYTEIDGEVQFGMDSMAFGDVIVPHVPKSITITGPNGGENWKKGSTQEIGWSYRGNPGASVKIQIYKGGALKQTIASSTPIGTGGVGVFSWKVPSTLAAGADYRIRISSVADPSITDLSDSFFGLTAANPAGALTLTYPNGGESLWMMKTDPVVIKWSFTGTPGPKVKVELYRGGNFFQTIAASISIGSQGNGMCNWYLPDGFSVESDYRIRVTSLWDATIWDESDADFSIAGRPGTITLTSPNGGESRQRGATYNLTWYLSYDWNTISLGPTNRIDLYKGGSWYMTIAPSAFTDYAFSWTIPACVPDGSDYKIRLTNNLYPQVYDESDRAFTISGGIPLSALVLKAPNGGESWEAGTTRGITWSTVGAAISHVRVDLYLGNWYLYQTLRASIFNRGYFIWHVPEDMGSHDLRILISSVSDPSIQWMSQESFSIHRSSPGAQINLVSPIGGELWETGSTREIVWTYSGITGNTATIELFQGDTRLSAIIPSTTMGSEGRGSYTWHIPATLKPGSGYRLRISSLSDPNLFDFSDARFSLARPAPPPSIKITSPNGGEILEQTSRSYIFWTYAGDHGGDVKLELLEGGSKVLTIASCVTIGADGSGFYPWTIPASLADGDDYAIRISSLSSAPVTDVSDKRFSIRRSPVLYKLLRKWGTEGTGDGQFLSPGAIVVDRVGNVYVADTENHRIQKFSATGRFLAKWGTRGAGNGQFDHPSGLAIDPAGNIYVADSWNRRIQKFDSKRAFLKKWSAWGSKDTQKFDLPTSIGIDSSGNVYVLDSGSCLVRKFSPAFSFLKEWGGRGPENGHFISPTGLAAMPSNGIYVVDSGMDRVQKFSASGGFLLKWGSQGAAPGRFNAPAAIALDGSGNVYVADEGNHRIQKFSPNGKLITRWGSQGNANGQFAYPGGVGADSQGNVYVVDTGNHRIQEFAPPTSAVPLP